MPDLILHHYPMSPFSEKIRPMLGYAGLSWQSVTVREMPPRPKLEALTGGYRKIPVAQIGADVFCDTRTIAREIAALSNRPELVVEDSSEDVQAFVRDADLEVFLACIISASGPGMLVKLAKSTSTMNALRFLKDRIAIGRKARVQPMAPKQARQRVKEHLERMEGMLEKDFLFGDSPCIADFSAYHGLWYVRDLAEKPVIRSYPRVNAWMDRIKAFGHGSPTALTADEALDSARSSEPRAISEQGSDPMLGKTVSIAPDDYAREPVTGVLVAANEYDWVLRRDTDDLGVLHVHLPKQGYKIRDA
ncbi:glutathione S-transferase [Halospina denitrificans]|uniref:Glutathione S-transferase n=1 Tax=Halospina denitrificans TaxID=332522 RepID=A0A4R7JXA6_9GAMM|nr:glutathione S-transferase family protein [Halospina denitrificans]TDT41699.1 glutathione S-transferase [Halospina denitrificans]